MQEGGEVEPCPDRYHDAYVPVAGDASKYEASREIITARRGRPPVGPVIEVRLPADTLAALDARAELEGMKRAELARLVLVREFPPVSIEQRISAGA
jgi:hypothetical protein